MSVYGQGRRPSQSLWAAALIGAGLMAAVDEIIFHQLLAWHHFYDRATPAVGLLSDGLLHAAELLAIVAGGFLVAGLIRRQELAPGWAWAGAFLGAGGFQLFDGLINHKVLRLHQIRYGVALLPYDVAWNAAGLALLLIGAALALRARAAGGAAASPATRAREAAGRGSHEPPQPR